MNTSRTKTHDKPPFAKPCPQRTCRSWLTLSVLTAVLTLANPGAAWADGFGITGNNPDAEAPPPKDPQQCDNQGNGSGGSAGSGGGGGQGSSPSSSAPIYFYNGREKLKHTDMVINGVYAIRLVRRYDSQSTYDSPLGYGWSFDHDRRIYEYPDNTVVIRYRCGDRDTLHFTGGAYVPAAGGLRGNLVEQPDGSFIFTYFDGTMDHYDAEGRLSASTDVAGNRLEYTYSTARRPLVGTSPHAIDPNKPMTVANTYQLSKIEERLADSSLSGNSLSFTYDPNTGRLTQATAGDGRVISYVHDMVVDGGNNLTSGNLVTVNGLEGKVSTYKYEDPLDNHNLTTIQDAAGVTPVINTYDTEDRVIKQVHGFHSMDIAYTVYLTETSVTHTITDAAGLYPYTATTVYRFNNDGYVTEVEDAEGYLQKTVLNSRNLIERQEFWDRTVNGVRSLLKAIDYGYDTAGHKLSESVTLDSGEVITRRWSYEDAWVASREVVSNTVPAKLFRSEYTFNYGSNGKPVNIKEEKRRRDDGSFQTITHAYNIRRQRISTTYPDGVKQHWEYTGGSLYPTRTYWSNAAGTALATNERYFTYDARGNLETVTDARGKVTAYVHDHKNRLIKITNPLGEETHYTYRNDRLEEIEAGRSIVNTVTVPGQIIKLRYNNEERLVEIQRLNDAGTPVIQQSFTYDSRGQRLTLSDGLNRTTQYAYDRLGRMHSITDARNNLTRFGYDGAGRRIQVIDALNRVTVNNYDDLDRLISTRQQGITPAAETRYSYDAAGNLIGVTDPESNLTQYTYDALSRKISEIRPLLQTLSYSYDGRDRLKTTVMARGQKFVYDYEPWGGLKLIDHYETTSATTPVRTQTFSYDLNGNLSQAGDSAIQAGALYTTTYDDLNRPGQTRVHYIPGGDRQMDYGYDAFGNRNGFSLSEPAGTTSHSYTVDALNRLTMVSLAGQNYTLDYDTANQLTGIAYPNSNTVAYTYENNGPVKSITLKDNLGAIREALSYTYDANLNVDNYSDNDGLYNFDYDGLDHLTLGDYPLGTGLSDDAFAYDKVGNREVPAAPAENTYNANNQLTALQAGAITFSYDADGNLLNKTDSITPTNNRTYTYDLNNRLIGFSQGSTTASYGYGPSGRRLFKTVNGSTTWFLWDGPQMVAEYTQSGAAVSLNSRYDYLPNDVVPTQISDGTGVYVVHSDHLTTPKLLTDSTGAIVWRSVRSAFGETTVNEDVDNNAAVVRLNIRFPGQYFDSESGLHYNYYRDYEPTIGRYTTSDPIGLRGGINTYLYANANPIIYSDTTGEVPVIAFAIVGAVIGGINGAFGASAQCGTAIDIVVAAGMGALGGGAIGALTPILPGGIIGSLTTGGVIGLGSNIAGQVSVINSSGGSSSSFSPGSAITSMLGSGLGGGLVATMRISRLAGMVATNAGTGVIDAARGALTPTVTGISGCGCGN